MFKTFLYAKMYHLTDFFEMMTIKPGIHRSFKNSIIIILLFSCTKTGGADGVDQSAKLVLEEAEEIVQFAEDNIAFDAQMIRLKDALHSGDTKKIVTVISEATQSAAEMLEDKGYYKAFCQYLFQEKGLLRKGDWKIFHTVYYTIQKKVTKPKFIYLLMAVTESLQLESEEKH